MDKQRKDDLKYAVDIDTAVGFKEGKFGEVYGLNMISGKLAGLHSRAIVVIDESGIVKYSQQVNEIADEPDYNKALEALK